MHLSPLAHKSQKILNKDTNGNLLACLISEVIGKFFVVCKFEYCEDIFVVFEGDGKKVDSLFDCTWFGIVGGFAVQQLVSTNNNKK